jgi:anti-sigma-K factor RskA
MNQQYDEILIDLLEKRAVYGLTEDEQKQLDELEGRDDISFELTASAITLAELGHVEEMPASLRAKLVADANEFFAAQSQESVVSTPSTETSEPRMGIWSWLGWALAGAALIALILNVWLTRTNPPQQQAGPGPTPTPLPEQPTPEQMRERLLASATDLARADIGPGTVKEITPTGDFVWSDAKQAGYVRVSGLPKNDPARQTYELWVFDETQDPKTPINAGTFDVSTNGEVIIPIGASLRVKNPKAFAISIEKPGGVVVPGNRIAALAKRAT